MTQLERNVRRLSHLDLPGAGQVYVAGQYAYVGHITNKQRLGTSIVDVSDPRKPRLVSQIHLDDPDSHSHKARVIGDLMIVNVEQNMGPLRRKAENFSSKSDSYGQGGFKVYDVSDRTAPKLITHHPDSDTVGSSGIVGERCAVVTASALRRPALT